ncbi:MAG: HYR domain-containing protein [Saprospiraceae bacterium]|nr:HYR domain-containing protein [Saprospiraceae bacterium]
MINNLLADCSLNAVNLNIGVDPTTCTAIIHYSAVLTGEDNPLICSPNAPSNFYVIALFQGDTIAQGLMYATIPTGHIGHTIMIKIKHLPSGNSSWSSVYITDKVRPTMACPVDVTIQCVESLDPDINTGLGQPTVSDCSAFTVNYTDVVNNFSCTQNSTFSVIVFRTWRATDAYNNTKTCTQTIYVARPNINDVVFPLPLDDISLPTLACDNPNTTPANTGYPTIYGNVLTSQNTCMLDVFHSDQSFPTCNGSFKIFRTWIVADWCTAQTRTFIQIISVKDKIPPTLVCPSSITVSTTGYGCLANAMLPSAQVSDNCDAAPLVRIVGENGINISSNGGVISNLPLGTQNIHYIATDACGNADTCTTTINVIDNTAPYVVCIELTTTTLNNLGQSRIYATSFNSGSNDNCCASNQLTYKVKRMGQPDAAFNDYIDFSCADVGNVIQVILQVTDCHGNSNVCMIQVTVEDKTPPVITCAPNVTITCLQNVDNQFIAPSVYDACNYTLTSTVINNIDNCGNGSSVRTWIASDNYGNQSTCSQTVVVSHVSNFVAQFPQDVTINNCSGDVSPSVTGQPIISAVDCELIAQNFTDEIFTTVADACYKIIRTWRVVNWCTYNPNNNVTTTNLGIPLGNNQYRDDDGYFKYSQIIKVMDNTPPQLICPNDIVVGVENNCLATVTFPYAEATDACSNQTSITVTSSLGTGVGPFYNVPAGVYVATHRATDGCGNFTTCTSKVIVLDNKKPTPVCINGLAIDLMPVDTNNDGVFDTGMINLFARNFNYGSYDNCTASGQLKISFSADVNDTIRQFSCNQIGTQFIEMWVTDANANQDFCQTYILIQDNNNACQQAITFANIAGNITTASGLPINAVAVQVQQAGIPQATNILGDYIFAGLPVNQAYSVTPNLDIAPANGVTTYDIVLLQKHILQLDTLDTPYQYIAADVNRSGTLTTFDLVEMRKLILGNIEQFSNNTSWRFIDANYQFQNPSNPLSESIPDVYNIDNLTGNMQINFVGVKIGDINNSAILNNLNGSVDRNAPEQVFFTKNITLEQGTTVEIPIRTQAVKDLVGLQLALDIDENYFSFDALQSDIISLKKVNYNYQNGQLKISWNTEGMPLNLPENEIIFTLKGYIKQTVQLSASLQLSSNFSSEIYTQNNFDITTEKLTLTNINADNQTENLLYANYPNPFFETTTIPFLLTRDDFISLEITDEIGQIIWKKTGYYTKGYHEEKFTKKETNGGYIYYFRLHTSTDSQIRKMVVVK